MSIHQSPVYTRETAIAAHKARRARMRANAVPDDGIVHPCERIGPKKRAPIRILSLPKPDPMLTIDEVLDRAAWRYPLPEPFTPDLSTEEDEEIVSLPKPPYVRPIQRAVCEHYGCSMLDLLSARRGAVIVRPRQVAMYLCKILTPHSLPEIGRRFGDKHHTTVLHAVRKMEVLIKTDEKLRETIDLLSRLLTKEA